MLIADDDKYRVIPSDEFVEELAKLSEEDKARVMKTLGIMRKTPFYPSLRTKRFRGYWESSVNMDIRIFWRFGGSNIIVTLGVGHHDIIRKHNKRRK